MQITKLSFLSTQSLGDSVFAVEEVVDIPIDQVFGSYRAREKALINFIGSDGVVKVSRDTWRIVKDITLEAANATMRQGDYFRVQLDEEGDDSPIHFDLDATGVFVLSRDVFASLQTYTVLEPGKLQAIRLQFTFGGKPVTDAKLTSKFSSLTLAPVDAVNGIYELQMYTAMAPSDDLFTLEITGVSLRNSVYEAPVRVTVREPILTLVPIDTTLHAEQTKDLTWQVLMEGKPAPVATPVQAVANPMKTGDVSTDLIAKIGDFKLIDPAKAIYSLNVKATDEVGAVSTIDTTYNFGSNFVAELPVPITLLTKESVYITHQTTSLEANKTQLIQITIKRGATEQAPVTDATAQTVVITGVCIFSVDPELVVIDAAKGIYAYRVTTNHKGGPISIRSVLETQGNPYPDFYNLTARATVVSAVALNTLPAADTADLTFRVTQPRLGGVTNIVGAVAKTFTVGGSAIASVNGPVVAVGQGVYKVNVTTNNRGGNVPVTATLTIDDGDVDVAFSTSAAALPQAVLTATGPALTGEATQAVPLKVTLSGVEYDMANPVVTVTGVAYVSNGVLRRTGAGLLEISDVNVNGKGGTLTVKVVGLVKGYSQTLTTTVPVTAVADVIATNVSHLRPTTTDVVNFTLTRGGVVVTGIKLGKATITSGVISAYDGTIVTLDANTGSFQLKSATATGPLSQTYFQISLPIVIKGYSYTVVFNSYVEAMPNLGTGGGSSSNPGAGTTPGAGGQNPTNPGQPGSSPGGILYPVGQLTGGDEQTYCMSWTIDGEPAVITSGTVTATGTPLISGPNPTLEVRAPGIACITGINTSDQAGDVTFDGTILIEGITYPFHFVLHNNRMAPTASNVTVLECESAQTMYFTLKQGPDIVSAADLDGGVVTGDAIEHFEGFALDSAASGRYRVDVVTNDQGGVVTGAVNVTINGTTYPVSFNTTAQSLADVGDGSGWALVSTAPTASKTAALGFSFTRGGIAVQLADTKDASVTGTTVTSSTNDSVRTSATGFKVSSVKLDNRAGDVVLKVSATLNGGYTWHALEKTFAVAQAPAPTITPQTKMMVARKEDVLTFTLTRGTDTVSGTITNVRVSGTPVGSAKQDVVVVSAAKGQYGTTLTPNDLGGNIKVLFDLNEGNVDYKDLTFTGSADIYHPWSATLVTGPTPEVSSYFDFQSHLDDGTLVAIDSATAVITGDCLVAPIGEVSLVYQDAGQKIYRIPNVMVNNNGGTLHIALKGIYQGGEVDLDFDYTVAPLPALAAAPTGADLPFRATTDLTFTVDRGSANPSVFTMANVKNLVVSGTPLDSYTPTIVQVSPGNYKISVTTNSNGGGVNVAFTVTLAGIDYPISINKFAVAEPPVSAASTNTLATNATATNLDFQLKRGTVPCADAFVVQSISIAGRSISSYPQTVINVDVSTGKYRIQVNTTAYSDDATVTINCTVRGAPTVLTFVVKIAAGVLPTVSLVSSSFDNGLQSSAQLSFLNGTSSINSAVTLDSIEGPITGATLDTAGVLSGVPTMAGDSLSFTINFLWKGGLYSAPISIKVTEIYPITTTSTQLAAYLNPNNMVLNMLNADGKPYPQTGWTFALVSATPYTVRTALAQQTDGTFTIGLYYTNEYADTPITFLATETATGNTRKHAMKVSFWFNMEARFSGTAALDSTSVSNLVQFDVYEINLNAQKTVNSTVALDSLTVKGKGSVNNITGWSSFAFLNGYRGNFYVSNNVVDVVDATYSFNWTSPLGRVYKIPGAFRLQRPPVLAWTDISGVAGAVQKTLKFTLASGSTPIADAIDATTTVTNATINKAPYLIDAATGTYGIDVTPVGNATSMVVTVKMKQPTMPTITYTFTAQTVTVTPAPIIATANSTLTRSPATGINMRVNLTQGGVAVSGITINSATVSSDSIWQITAGPSAGTGYVQWTVKTAFSGASPKIHLNLTIGGVGYVFDLDYPIEANATIALAGLNTAVTATKGVKTSSSYPQRVTANGSTLVNLPDAFGVTGYTIPDGYFVAASNNVTLSSASIYTSDTTLLTTVYVPTAAGAQTWRFKLKLYGVVYDVSFDVTVSDTGSITILSGGRLTAEQANTVTMNLAFADGSLLDGTETVTYKSSPRPTNWPATGTVVRNTDGTYSLTVTPTGESAAQQLQITVVKGSTTSTFVSPYSLDTYFNFKLKAPTNFAAGTLVQASCQVVSAISGKDITTLASWSLTNTGSGPDASTLKYTASVPDSLDTVSRVVDYVLYSTGLIFRFQTKVTDYATIVFSIEATSPVTGLRYTFVSDPVLYNDTIVSTMIGPTALQIGADGDVQYKLTYQTSGKPVTQAIAPTGTTTAGSTTMVVKQGFKVIDQANGIYAVTFTPTTTADTATISTAFRFTLALSNQATLTVATYTITAYRPVSMVFPAVYSATRTVPVILRDANGLVTNATITGVQAGTYLDATSGSWTCQDKVNGLYMIDVTHSKTSQLPIVGNLTNANTVTETVNVTYTDGNGVSKTVPMFATLHWLPIKLALPKTTPIVSDGAAKYFPTANGASLAAYTNGTSMAYDMAGTRLAYSANYWSDSWSADIGPGSRMYFGKGVWKDRVFLNGSMTRTVSNVSLTYLLYIDDFPIQRYPYLVVSDPWTNPYVKPATVKMATSGANTISANPIPTFVITVVDDLGAPVKGATMTAFSNTWMTPGPTSTSDLTAALVPVTDGSDGRYTVKLYLTGYTNAATGAKGSFYPNFTLSAPGYGDTSFQFNIGINT